MAEEFFLCHLNKNLSILYTECTLDPLGRNMNKNDEVIKKEGIIGERGCNE